MGGSLAMLGSRLGTKYSLAYDSLWSLDGYCENKIRRNKRRC